MAVKRSTKAKKRWRFFKSGLPGIVWDPKKNKAMANFMISEPKGTFITDDPKVAKILREKGYPEIPVNAKEPPAIAVIDPGRSLEEGENVPVMSPNANPILAEAKMAGITGKPQAPQVLTQ